MNICCFILKEKRKKVSIYKYIYIYIHTITTPFYFRSELIKEGPQKGKIMLRPQYLGRGKHMSRRVSRGVVLGAEDNDPLNTQLWL